MRTIGSYELKTHLSKILDEVEHGQTVVVTRHGKPIARISPSIEGSKERTRAAIKGLREFPRTRLPKGITVRSLIDEGRR